MHFHGSFSSGIMAVKGLSEKNQTGKVMTYCMIKTRLHSDDILWSMWSCRCCHWTRKASRSRRSNKPARSKTSNWNMSPRSFFLFSLLFFKMILLKFCFLFFLNEKDWVILMQNIFGHTHIRYAEWCCWAFKLLRLFQHLPQWPAYAPGFLHSSFCTHFQKPSRGKKHTHNTLHRIVKTEGRAEKSSGIG